MSNNLIALLFMVGVVVLFAFAEYLPRLIHLAIHHHWPFYKYRGYDNYGFNEYGDDCLRCR